MTEPHHGLAQSTHLRVGEQVLDEHFFHSLVGLAAVFIAWAAFLAPKAFGVGEPFEGD